MNIINAFKTDLPLSKKLLFVWKSLIVWPYAEFIAKHGYGLQRRYYQTQRLWKLTRDNMTAEEMAADDKVWADWFQQHSWDSMFAAPEKKPAMKREIDFMAKQRMIGNHFDVAAKAYRKSGGAS